MGTKQYVLKDTCNARFNNIHEDLNEIKGIVENIRNNHLNHINKDIQTLKTYMQLIGFVTGTIASIMISYAIKKFIEVIL